MKKTYLLGLALAIIGNAQGQSMSENFDSRAVGEYMGVVSPDWTTWSGTVGGAEDVQVTDLEAASGTNSIYFSTTSPSGGPQDVLVPFGGIHSTGTFTFESKFYVEDNKGAYFNFQGTLIPGGMYTLNCQMVDDNRLLLDAGSAPLIETTYPSDTWFTLTLNINLNSNDWELLIDGVSQGMFSNPNNQLASADLYPVNNAAGGNNNAGFFMDDVSYELVPYILPERNLGTIEILNTYGLAAGGMTPSVKVRNLGTSTITSFDLDIEYNGTVYTENIVGVSITSLSTYQIDLADVYTLIAGENDITATISNVNGIMIDDDATDDSKSKTLDPLVPAPGKVVVGEEATGTWCGWCPRGAVFLELMDDRYPDHFIGVAVHNGDPMAVESYDTPIGAFISGYPSLLVDRGPSINPAAVEGDFLDRIVVAPMAVLTIGSDYTVGSTAVNVSVTADFIEDISGDYRLALIVVEDHVTGTASGYNQVNYYAGGDTEMGGYESLPNPVPAADMVYDHVGRAILPSFNGFPGSFPDDVTAGENYTVNFNVDLDPTWDLSEIHFVGILIAPDSKIDNAGRVTLDESSENGFVLGVEDNDELQELNAMIHPNPAGDFTNITIGDLNNEQVLIQIYNMNGAIVAERNYGELSGSYVLPVQLDRFESGIYTVRIIKGNSTQVEKLIVR